MSDTDNTSTNKGKKGKSSSSKSAKRRKVAGPSKKDKSAILSALLQSENDSTSFFDVVASIDPEILKRSLSHILNNFLDYDSLPGQSRSIDQFLEETDVVYRFAPAPTGELHIGHVVPIILNTLFMQIGRNYGRQTRLVIRIDDTDPDVLLDRHAACEGVDILSTIRTLLRTDLTSHNIICYNSSDYVDQIVGVVLDSIRVGEDYFYPDPTSQDDIRAQRSDRIGSSYRDSSTADRISLLDRFAEADEFVGVIRAKIDPTSDNGNLRDPVLIRVQFVDGVLHYFPTYDLVCPVLDLYDSRRFNTDSTDSPNSTLLALRDCNYFDRLEQYQWIQRALASSDFIANGGPPVIPTSMCTFSRVNIENALLSKRRIRQLIQKNMVGGWDDPRLFTVPGIMARGMTFAGLANFYWVSSVISTANRSSTMTLESFFAHYDKLLSRTVTPIVNRLHRLTEVDADMPNTSIYDGQIISYRSVVLGDLDQMNDPQVLGDIRIDLNQILTPNLMNYKKAGVDPDHLNTLGVDASAVVADLKAGEFSNLFLHGTDLRVGQIVKLNNFKNDSIEEVYGGFYLILKIDHQNRQILFASISN